MLAWVFEMMVGVVVICLTKNTVCSTNFTFSVLEGADATLPCILPPQLSENNTVYWYHGTEIVSRGDNISMTGHQGRLSLYRPYPSDWYLRISPVVTQDEGVYQCHVTEDFMSVTELIVESPPVVTGYQADKIYLQVCDTARVTLYCNVTGRPAPTIQWYKRTSPDKLKYLELNSESIFIPDVDSSNAGIYLCMVTNKHGQTKMEFHITVVDLVEELITVNGPHVPYQSEPVMVSGSTRSTRSYTDHLIICIFFTIYNIVH